MNPEPDKFLAQKQLKKFLFPSGRGNVLNSQINKCTDSSLFQGITALAFSRSFNYQMPAGVGCCV